MQLRFEVRAESEVVETQNRATAFEQDAAFQRCQFEQELRSAQAIAATLTASSSDRHAGGPRAPTPPKAVAETSASVKR